MSEPLAGKIAFVTGGARGIGRAIALKLAAAGCDVAIAYHNSHEEAETVVNAVAQTGTPRFRYPGGCERSCQCRRSLRRVSQAIRSRGHRH